MQHERVEGVKPLVESSLDVGIFSQLPTDIKTTQLMTADAQHLQHAYMRSRSRSGTLLQDT